MAVQGNSKPDCDRKQYTFLPHLHLIQHLPLIFAKLGHHEPSIAIFRMNIITHTSRLAGVGYYVTNQSSNVYKATLQQWGKTIKNNLI
jgi:hypothetical protein